MAIKDFFWTFGNDGLDEYINRLIQEENRIYKDRKKKREVKEVSEKFDKICEIFKIDKYFRIEKNTNKGIAKIGEEGYRNGGYAFNKKLGCKIINLIQMNEREKLKNDLEEDSSKRRDAVVDTICQYININKKSQHKVDYHKTLMLINNINLCSWLGQYCFIEKGIEGCSCQLFECGQCVPLLIKRIFDIYDKKISDKRKLFEVNELNELAEYFERLALEQNSVDEYKYDMDWAYKNDSYVRAGKIPDVDHTGFFRPDLFNMIKPHYNADMVNINRKEIGNIVRGFDIQQIMDRSELETYVKKAFKFKINHNKIISECINSICRWYVFWETVIEKYCEYICRNAYFRSEYSRTMESELMLKYAIWYAEHEYLDDSAKELMKKFQCEKIYDGTENNMEAENNIEDRLINKCAVIINDFFDSNLSEGCSPLYQMLSAKMLSAKELNTIEIYVYTDLQDIGQHISIAWKIDDSLYIDNLLHLESVVSIVTDE